MFLCIAGFGSEGSELTNWCLVIKPDHSPHIDQACVYQPLPGMVLGVTPGLDAPLPQRSSGCVLYLLLIMGQLSCARMLMKPAAESRFPCVDLCPACGVLIKAVRQTQND